MNELDQLVAEYKHIADNHGEHRVKDLVWLVNELIYEREHQSAGVTPREIHETATKPGLCAAK